MMDISKKHGLEYRLLHAVTAGHSWYGNWGYEFGTGSFALTADAYRKAVESLANLPLSVFFSHSRSPRGSLQDTISMYCALSDRQLVTIGELFSFVTRLLRDAEGRRAPPGSPACRAAVPCGVLCAWTGEEAGRLEAAMIKLLRAAGVSRWVSWRTLRGAVCRQASSPALLDYCLKGLAGKPAEDGMAVAVRCNADTRAIEFR